MFSEASEILQVQTGVDPVVTLLSPETNKWFNYSLFNLSYNATDANDDIKNATLIINGLKNISTTTILNGGENNFSINFSNGEYNWTIEVFDYLGNSNKDVERKFYIDLENPEVNLFLPENNTNFTSNEVILNFEARDNLDTNLSCDILLDSNKLGDTIFVENSSSINLSTGKLSNGLHNWNVSCKDNSGRVGASQSFQFRILDTPPKVSLNFPQTNFITSNENITLRYTPVDNSGFLNCSLIFNSVLEEHNQTAILNNTENSFVKTGLDEGVYNWTVGCYDLSENYFEDTVRNFSVDLNEPEINLVSPINNSLVNFSDVYFNFTVMDSLDSELICSLTLNGVVIDDSFSVSNGTFSSRLEENLTDGAKQWKLTCSDDSAREGLSDTFEFNLSENPEISLVTENESSYQITAINLTYIPSDNVGLSYCSLYLNNNFKMFNQSNILNNQENNFSLFGLLDGDYSWYVNCSDYFIGKTISEERFFKIDGGAPDITLFEPNGEDIYESNVSFNFTVIDSVDSNLSCNLSIDDVIVDSFYALNNTIMTRNISGISDGFKKWQVNCSDSSNNLGASLVYNFTKFSNPVVSLISPENNTWMGQGNFNFTYYIEDDQGFTNASLIINSVLNQTNSSKLNNFNYNNFSVNFPNGEYNWKINVTDVTGLVGSSEVWTVYVDNQNPSLEIFSPLDSEVVNTNNVSFNFSVLDNLSPIVSCNLSIDGEVESSLDVLNNSNEEIFLLVNDGNHSWDIECFDLANNSNLSLAQNFTVIAPPTIELISPNTEFRTNLSQINLTYKPYDAIGIKNCSIYLDGVINGSDNAVGNGQENNFSLTSISEGEHNWSVGCYDLNDVFGNSSFRNFYIDKTPPKITLVQLINDSAIDFNERRVSFSWNASDILDSLLRCDLNIDGIKRKDNLLVTSGILNTEQVFSNIIGQGYHYWSVTCRDRVGNSNISEQRWFNLTLPDFFINVSLISFNQSNPKEKEMVLISAEIFNNEGSDSKNIKVQFYDGNPSSGGIQIGQDILLNISRFNSTNTSVIWQAEMGTSEIYVLIDPPINSVGDLNETNETNNFASRNISVGAWYILYGDISSSSEFALKDSGANKVLTWLADNFKGGNLYVTDYEASVDWLNLQAIGKKKDNSQSNSDFEEIDNLLGMENFEDSVKNTYTFGGFAKDKANFTTFSKVVEDVPIINSTNNSNFITGILWDSSDSQDEEFDSSEDLVFISKISNDLQGKFGKYDYEIKVPAALRNYNSSDSDKALFYVELI